MKKPRFSLYAQILLWFFLNLALVAAVLFIVLKVQFNVGFESLLSGRVGSRMEATGCSSIGARGCGPSSEAWSSRP